MPRARKYRNIIKQITTLHLTQPDNLHNLTEQELFADLTTSRGTSLFLGFYSKKGILFALNRLSILSRLAKSRLDSICVEIDTRRTFQHIFRAYNTTDKKKHLISEVVMRRGTFRLPEEIQLQMAKKSFDILVVEWFLLQNPLAEFTKEKPQLPGQMFPGLGLGTSVLEIFYWIARRAKADGVLVVPTSLHVAVYYSSEFHFVNPRQQAILRSMQRDLLKKKQLAQVAWAAEEGMIVDQKKGLTFKWIPSEMILPASKAMNDYFFSNYYRSQVRKYQRQFSFIVKEGYRKYFSQDWLPKTVRQSS